MLGRLRGSRTPLTLPRLIRLSARCGIPQCYQTNWDGAASLYYGIFTNIAEPHPPMQYAGEGHSPYDDMKENSLYIDP